MTMGKIEKLGEMVRRTRREQELTQEELAAMTGVGVRFIRELEQGKESCHMGKALNVAAMLGIEIRAGGITL